MGMASCKYLKLEGIILILSSIIVKNVFSANVEISPTASVELTYSDNINLDSTNENSGFVSTWSAGVITESIGNNGELLFGYDVYQTFNLQDSSENKLFNELSLFANRKIYKDSVELETNATITNIARSIQDNANPDIISGNTIETRSIDAEISYQNNPRGYFDIYGSIYGSATSNEDGIGDYYAIESNIVFQNGLSEKDYFWLTDYSYEKNISANTKESYYNYEIDQEVGIQTVYGVSPLIHAYYEGYTTGNQDKVVESGSWGPGVRYYLHRRSYVELGYEFSINDRDFWRWAVSLNPNPRTFLAFDYTRKFYGDSYDFTLININKRMTNTISYREELEGFERQFFVVGENIEEFQLVKELSMNSSFITRRTTFSFDLRAQERLILSDSDNVGSDNVGDSKLYGSKLAILHNISNLTSLSASFQFDIDKFDSEPTESLINYYRIFDVSLENQISNSIFWDVSLRHVNSSIYKENRANFTVSVEY
ncbi:hypothetical protein [Vibrio sp. PNB22_1_1]